MTELAHRRPQSVAEHAQVDYAKALQYLGLTPGQPAAQALILVCKRYDLDPLLGHVSLYDGKPYVHFAGYLHIANAHAQFAGIECVKEWDDDTYFWATVRVHRADRDFPAERTGKSRKQKRKRDGSTYTDEDADAKAFAQACRRALRMAFNVDHPDPAEDEGAGPAPAPPPVVEVARRIEQTSDPADLTPPVRHGSEAGEGERGSRPGDRRHDPSPATTSEGPATRTDEAPGQPGRHRGRPSDDNASATGSGDTDASTAGQEPPDAEASTSPSSPGDGTAGRGRGGRAGPGRSPDVSRPPAEPAQAEEAEQAAFEQGLADEPGRWTR